jgi:MFS family permease
VTQTPITAGQEWRKNWPLVFAGLIGMAFYSVVTYSLGTFIAPLEEEFGWSRAAISAGLTIFTITAMIGGPLIGALIDRVGTRRVALPGIALHAAAFAGLGLADGNLVQWYLLWTVLALAALSTRSLVWSTAVSSVFTVNRSLALSVMLSGTALGQMSPILAAWLIDGYGWRQAYMAIGGLWGGLGFVLVLLFFHDAREQQRRAGQSHAAATSLPGLTLAQATRDSRIIRIGVANLLLTAVGSGLAVHLVPILGWTGLARSEAVAIAAMAGITGIAGKLVTGWLLDRVQGSIVPFATYVISASGYFTLLQSDGSRGLAMLAVLLLGYSSGAGLQVTTYLVTRYAGLRNFGKVFGTISSLMMLGTSIGPVFAGFMYDATSSYQLLLTIAIPAILLCGLCFIGLGPYPRFDPPQQAQP